MLHRLHPRGSGGFATPHAAKRSRQPQVLRKVPGQQHAGQQAHHGPSPDDPLRRLGAPAQHKRKPEDRPRPAVRVINAEAS